jgi:pyridoxal 5'-phosphate synthase pdxS subunit
MSGSTDIEGLKRGTDLIKRGFAKMQKGGVIMDVVTREQARIAEDTGAVAVMRWKPFPPTSESAVVSPAWPIPAH